MSNPTGAPAGGAPAGGAPAGGAPAGGAGTTGAGAPTPEEVRFHALVAAGVRAKDAAALVWGSSSPSATEVVVEGCRAATAVADATTATAKAATGTLVALHGLKTAAATPAPVVFAAAPAEAPVVAESASSKYKPYVIGGLSVVAVALVGVGGILLYRHLSSGRVTDASGVDVPLHLVGNG